VPETIVMLHGFGGTHRAWDGVAAALDPERYRPLAIDLPGHGGAANVERPITFAGCVAQVLAGAPERFALCGYSLGGRIAMHVALAAPRRVSRLVLISCSPGIEDREERAQRRVADEALARELERGPFESFIERWRTQPLFAGDPPAVARLARADQWRNDPQALAAVLRGVGTGRMVPLWDKLGEITMPTRVVVGERDSKYVALGERMTMALPEAVLEILPGGHALHLECPTELAPAFHQRLGDEVGGVSCCPIDWSDSQS
jgi:2-succinyl-6-hydroxy-2,4-cyclohexadiene-1-carboxylate synthase